MTISGGLEMAFAMRAVIALLSGVGAGVVGFWAVWQSLRLAFGANPAIGHDAWLVAGIFGPGVLGVVLVFVAVSRLEEAARRRGHEG
jgi:hypothetical protein